MADIRPKDLLPTAMIPAADDYLLLDGATNGTRKFPALGSLPVISAVAFGAVGDGTTDNATALLTMRDYCEANFQSTGVEVRFAPGTYQYSDNKWLPNCRFVICRGPAKLQCTQGAGTSANEDPLYSGDIFTPRWTGNPGAIAGRHTGYAIEDAASLATTVTLVDEAAAAHFSVGMPVFIHGYNHQDAGYPFNLRYFEWHEVAAIEGGVLALTGRLRYRYSRTNWRDYNYYADAALIYGKPRIVPLHRTDFYCRQFLLIEDLEWLNNPNRPYPAYDNGFQPVARHVVLNRVRIPGHYWPAMTETITATDCDIEWADDLDKCVDTCVIDRCRINSSLQSATGINNVVVRNSVINGRVRLGARRWEVTGCKVISDTEYGVFMTRESTPSSFVRIVDNDAHTDNNTNYLINNIEYRLTAGATSAGSFKVAPANHDSFYQLDIGHQVWNTNFAKVSTIHDLTWDGTDYVVRHGADVTFTEGESITFNPMKGVTAHGNRLYKAGVLVDQQNHTFRNGGPFFEELDGRKVYRGRPYINGFSTNVIPTPFNAGRVQRATIVARAVHGSAVRWLLRAHNGVGNEVIIALGNSPAAGDYIIADFVAGTTTFIGSWTHTSGLVEPWVGLVRDLDFRIELSNGMPPTYTSFADTPYFEIILDGVTGLGG